MSLVRPDAVPAAKPFKRSRAEVRVFGGGLSDVETASEVADDEDGGCGRDAAPGEREGGVTVDVDGSEVEEDIWFVAAGARDRKADPPEIGSKVMLFC